MSAGLVNPSKVLLWALLCVPTMGLAQGLAGQISSLSSGSPLTTPGTLTKSAQLQAIKGSSSASIKLSKIQSFSKRDDKAVFDTWSITASAPLSKSGDDTTIANLDGLTNSASLELGFSQFRAPGVKRSAAEVFGKVSELDVVCRRVFEARKLKENTPVPDKLEGCDANLVYTHGDSDDIHAFDSAFWNLDKSRARWLWGGTAKLGYQDYEYLTTDSTTKQKRNETPWSVGAWGAVQPGDVPWLLLANVQYQRAFKDGDNAVVCPVPTPPNPTVCAAGALNAPKSITKKLLTLELRGRPGDFGFALSVTRDFEAKVTGVDIPLYLVADKDGKLTAGLKAGWRSDTKKAGVGIFVGVPFGLYNR